MANASEDRVSYVSETVYATTPSAQFQEITLLNGELSYAPTITPSNSISGQRTVTGSMITDAEGSAQFSVAMKYGAVDEFIEGAFAADFASDVNLSGDTFSVDATASTISDTDNGMGSLSVGDMIYVDGFTSAGNNGWKQITAAAAGSITIYSASALTTESAGDSVTIKGAILKNAAAAVKKSFTIERYIGGGDYYTHPGKVVNEMTLSFSKGNDAGRVTAEFSLIGAVKPTIASSSASTGAWLAASTNEEMGVVHAVDDVVINGTAATPTNNYYVQSISITTNTNARAVDIVNSVDTAGFEIDQFNVTGELQILYQGTTGKALVQKLYDAGTNSMSFSFTDVDGKAYAVCVPKFRLTGGEPNIPGGQEDIVLTLPFQAEELSTTDPTTLVISKVDNS